MHSLMPQVTIENPIIHLPFDEPTLLVRSSEDTIQRSRGIGPSSSCAPLAQIRKVAQLLYFISCKPMDGISIQESSTGNGAA
jgi:hypothetical protein